MNPEHDNFEIAFFWMDPQDFEANIEKHPNKFIEMHWSTLLLCILKLFIS